MTTRERSIIDIAQAHIHRNKQRLACQGKMKTEQFILQNKGAIKAIYDQLRLSYNLQRNKELDKCFKLGVEAFLQAEGLLG